MKKRKTHIVQFRHQHQFSLNVWDGIVQNCLAGQDILLQTQWCCLLTFLEHILPITGCYPVGYSTKHGSCIILPQPMPVIAPEITMRLPTLGDRKVWTSNLAKLFISPETSSFFPLGMSRTYGLHLSSGYCRVAAATHSKYLYLSFSAPIHAS